MRRLTWTMAEGAAEHVIPLTMPDRPLTAFVLTNVNPESEGRTMSSLLKVLRQAYGPYRELTGISVPQGQTFKGVEMETMETAPRKITIKAIEPTPVGVEGVTGETYTLTLNVPRAPMKLVVIKSDDIDVASLSRLAKQLKEQLGEGTLLLGVGSEATIEVYEEET